MPCCVLPEVPFYAHDALYVTNAFFRQTPVSAVLVFFLFRLFSYPFLA